MTPREKERSQFAWLLNEIRKKNAALENPAKARFEFHLPDGEVPTYAEQEVLLSRVEQMGGIKIGEMRGRMSIEAIPGEVTAAGRSEDEYVPMEVPGSLRLEILQPRFNELCEQYEVDRNEAWLVSKITVYVSGRDGLHIEQKGEKRTYPLEGKRLKLFRYFLKSGRNRVKLKTLVKELAQSESSVSRAIGEVNRIGRERFKVTDDLIEHPEGRGYVLNRSKFHFEMVD